MLQYFLFNSFDFFLIIKYALPNAHTNIINPRYVATSSGRGRGRGRGARGGRGRASGGRGGGRTSALKRGTEVWVADQDVDDPWGEEKAWRAKVHSELRGNQVPQGEKGAWYSLSFEGTETFERIFPTEVAAKLDMYIV